MENAFDVHDKHSHEDLLGMAHLPPMAREDKRKWITVRNIKRGGDSSGLYANYPPPPHTHTGQFWEGRWGGDFAGGGGSDSCEQLGMRPRCDPTVYTIPSLTGNLIWGGLLGRSWN